MSVAVRIPTTLRSLTGGAKQVTVEGSTVAEVLANLDAAHPGFSDRLLDDSGANEHVCIWAMVDPTAPKKIRTFTTYGTGHIVENKHNQFVGTVQAGAFVWHVFEEIPE